MSLIALPLMNICLYQFTPEFVYVQLGVKKSLAFSENNSSKEMSDKAITGDHLDPSCGASGGGITDSPLHGPTLSTSTSSFEALDPHDPSLSRLATKMFQKTNEYVAHELNTCLDDYQLLENLNRATISKYSDMNQIAENLVASSGDMKRKFDELVGISGIMVSVCSPIIVFDFLHRCLNCRKLTKSSVRSKNWSQPPTCWMRTAKNSRRNTTHWSGIRSRNVFAALIPIFPVI